MGQRLPPDQMQLYRRIDEILFYIWDPIGISHTDWPRDEYQSYLPRVFRMVLNKNPKEEIREYLISIEADHMGLGRRLGIQSRIEDVVSLLFQVRESLLDKPE